MAAYVGSLLALRKTKRETQWQAKYEAYQKILAAVESMRICAEETYSARHLLPSLTDEKLVELGHRYQEAKRELWSHVRVGELVVSSDARASLADLLSAISSEEIRFERKLPRQADSLS